MPLYNGLLFLENNTQNICSDKNEQNPPGNRERCKCKHNRAKQDQICPSIIPLSVFTDWLVGYIGNQTVNPTFLLTHFSYTKITISLFFFSGRIKDHLPTLYIIWSNPGKTQQDCYYFKRIDESREEERKATFMFASSTPRTTVHGQTWHAGRLFAGRRRSTGGDRSVAPVDDVVVPARLRPVADHEEHQRDHQGQQEPFRVQTAVAAAAAAVVVVAPHAAAGPHGWCSPETEKSPSLICFRWIFWFECTASCFACGERRGEMVAVALLRRPTKRRRVYAVIFFSFFLLWDWEFFLFVYY